MKQETCCRHMGCSFRLAARVLSYAPSHRQDSTYHSLCYTSRGALAGTRNSSSNDSVPRFILTTVPKLDCLRCVGIGKAISDESLGVGEERERERDRGVPRQCFKNIFKEPSLNVFFQPSPVPAAEVSFNAYFVEHKFMHSSGHAIKTLVLIEYVCDY